MPRLYLLRRFCLAIAMPLLAAAPALAAADGVEVSRGHDLATSWCAACHAVERGAFIGPYDDVPSFAAIAHEPAITETAIRVFLQSNHPNMPDFKLTPAEIDAVVGYIESLRP